jgi:hypothetical protein
LLSNCFEGDYVKNDSNGDGTYDTTIPPTASSTKTTASDITPPKVNINITQFGASSNVAISAIDAESGIKQIMYSINGQGFNIYTSPVTLNVSSPTTILAVADNNVGIRSGVYRKNILVPTAANSSISGRVTNLRGSTRTVFTLTRASTGESLFARPNQLGYYRFENLATECLDLKYFFDILMYKKRNEQLQLVILTIQLYYHIISKLKVFRRPNLSHFRLC